MKGLIYSILLSMVYVGGASAQFSLSAGGGLNYGKAALLDTDVLEHTKLLGFHLGVFTKFQIKNRVKLGLDFQCSEERFRSFEAASPKTTVITTLTYLRLIPHVNLELFEDIYFLTGINSGYLLRDRHRFEVGGQALGKIKVRQKIDFGLIGGIRLDMGRLELSGMFNFGLIDIGNTFLYKNGGLEDDDSVLKNRVLQVGFGYRVF